MVLNAPDHRTLPPGWRWVRLGEICTIIAGQSPPGETYRKTPEGMPFFQGKADFGPKHPVASTWCTAPTKIARAGDILISVRAPVGPTNVADVECCIGRGLAAIRSKDQTDRDFVLAALKLYENRLADKGSGSTFHAITRDVLESLTLPLPPLPEQRRIAAILNEQMAAVERARAACKAQVAAARALPAAYLREVFESAEAQQWPKKRLDDVCNLLPSKSIATTGDADVLTVTTACLTEFGFNPSGLKPARMWTRDVAACSLSAGEILVARSNTPELVGRVALYQGTPPGVVASDLTIRVWPGSDVRGEFLAGFLSFLYLGEYWKERAGGASGSMKKITRTQICDLPIPVPGMAEQLEIERALSERIAAAARTLQALQSQLDAINRLPAALLRRAFDGEL